MPVGSGMIACMLLRKAQIYPGPQIVQRLGEFF